MASVSNVILKGSQRRFDTLRGRVPSAPGTPGGRRSRTRSSTPRYWIRSLPGSGRAPNLAPFGNDLINPPTAWKRHKDLSSLQEMVVRIRFKLRNAKLYAFKIG